MGATYEFASYDDPETDLHVSRGKLDPAGTTHPPQWGKPYHQDMGFWVKDCLHPNCELFIKAERPQP
ncbi:MAG: hypothetical protein K0R44_31 [Thermomicrobiales bacterium]|jgi:hypothetical protein|nr:hypothetical protein [Thermomicrobiales bacterium]MDF3014806.1 hypothetical protein [Thermomicrobiales bacterium]